MKRFILRTLLVLVVLVIGAVGFAASRFNALSKRHHPVPHFTIAADVQSADPALGRRIYAVRSGCIECHGENLAGAVVMENGAMGSIHGANLTPFNLHDWSDEEIATAIRYGVNRNGQSLHFMPSFEYLGLSKGDLAALIAYLRSVPAVETAPHENTFGPVCRALSVLGKMPIMFPADAIDPTTEFPEKPVEGPTAEFGHYLAASCVGCHGQNYQGGPIPGGDPSWPPAANIRFGSNPVWTEAAFATMIRTGISPTTGKTLQPPMPISLLQHYNGDEVTALWKYLHTLN